MKLILIPIIPLLVSCGVPPELPEVANPEREACYLKARLAFHQRASDCETDECIDMESESQRLDQEACP